MPTAPKKGFFQRKFFRRNIWIRRLDDARDRP